MSEFEAAVLERMDTIIALLAMEPEETPKGAPKTVRLMDGTEVEVARA